LSSSNVKGVFVRKLVIFGARGQVGSEIVRAAPHHGFTPIALGRAELDIVDEPRVDAVLDDVAAGAVAAVNAAAYTAVDLAETDRLAA